MANLKDYFLSDAQRTLKVTSTQEVTTHNGLKIPVQIFQDFESGSVYLAFFLQQIPNALECCSALIIGNAIPAVLEAAPSFVIEGQSPSSVALATNELKFTGRVYFYSENSLNAEELRALIQLAKDKNLLIEYFDPDWAIERGKTLQPLAFISHDSRDKASIAKPLVDELLQFPDCKVWYDEYSLHLGDHLRENIEKGLKECKKCVLLLSKNFLSNNGWTKEEFNAIFTRQLIEESNVILPIWCNVTKKDIYDYSPSLANKFAVQWENNPKEVAKKIYLAANR